MDTLITYDYPRPASVQACLNPCSNGHCNYETIYMVEYPEHTPGLNPCSNGHFNYRLSIKKIKLMQYISLY